MVYFQDQNLSKVAFEVAVLASVAGGCHLVGLLRKIKDHQRQSQLVGHTFSVLYYLAHDAIFLIVVHFK